jgi:hypothetical protein
MALGLRTGITVALAVGLLPLAAPACQSSATQPPARTAPQATHSPTFSAPTETSTAGVAPKPAPATIRLGARSGQFLVRKVESDQILLVSQETADSRVLTPAAAALFQPEFALLWFRDGERLKVLDLEKQGAAPVTVAEGLPEVDRFSITGHGASVDTDDGCDLAWIELTWSATPTIESLLEAAPQIRIVNRDWLVGELPRPPRKVGERREFSSSKSHVRLPKKLLECEDANSCGAALELGNRGLELVLVRQRAGGDCVQAACLLRDPKTGLFATPPSGSAWAKADKTRPGPCGPYMFDRTQSSFLVGDRLCTADGGCKKLGGVALGWLEPGDTIGDPGLGNFEDQE